jgi:hypothetical protein
VFFGAGKTIEEMDLEFKKLYDSLIVYKNNIFHLIDTLCNDCEAGERLAINIAERDSTLLQRLVAKECDQRRMARKATKESVLDQLRMEKQHNMNLNQILQLRQSLLRDTSNQVKKD